MKSFVIRSLGPHLTMLCLALTLAMSAWANAATSRAVDGGDVEPLPVIHLTYDPAKFSSEQFIYAQFALTEADSTRQLLCQVRRRGATSLIYDKPNFALKFVHRSDSTDNDVRLLGMRKDNYWILDAMASDCSKMRNRVSMDLWLASSRQSYQQALEPEAINGYRGRYVEIYANDDYLGLFCLMERVDRKQLKLKKYKAMVSDTLIVNDTIVRRDSILDHESFKKDAYIVWTDTIVQPDTVINTTPAYHRGLLYKAVNGHGTRTPYLMWQSNEPDDTRPTYDGMQAEYPDPADGEPFAWNPLRDNIYYLASKTSTTFNRNIGQRFDVPVFIDYVLFIDLLFANDNVGKNVLFWYYDQSSEYQRIGITPWDLDTSWGRDYMSGRVSATRELTNKSNFHTRFLRWYNDYTTILEERYAELRDSLWRQDSLLSRFDGYFDLLGQTGAWQRELDRWRGSNCRLNDLDAERAYIHQWVKDRLVYLDTTYHYVAPEPEPNPDLALPAIELREPEGQRSPGSRTIHYDLFGRLVDPARMRFEGNYIIIIKL